MKKEEGIIDIHCHILPALDDGPPDREEALLMLEEAKKQGVSEIVATPHLIWGGEILKIEDIELAINDLPNFIKLYPGCEVPLLEAPSLFEEGKIIATGKLILLDTPPIGGLSGLEQFVFKIVLKRYKPVIAHPERNPSFARDIRRLQHLKNMGALFQINADSLVGVQGKEMRRAAENLLEEGIADILASDAHNPEGFKYLREAFSIVANRYGVETAKAMTRTNIEHFL
ncbi:MAG: tyrosine-protein phosphatase [bacterium]